MIFGYGLTHAGTEPKTQSVPEIAMKCILGVYTSVL